MDDEPEGPAAIAALRSHRAYPIADAAMKPGPLFCNVELFTLTHAQPR